MFGSLFYEKRDFNTGVFPWNLLNFLEHLFYRAFPCLFLERNQWHEMAYPLSDWYAIHVNWLVDSIDTIYRVLLCINLYAAASLLVTAEYKNSFIQRFVIFFAKQKLQKSQIMRRFMRFYAYFITKVIFFKN